MKKYITNKNPNKKQKKEENSKKRNVWSICPITRVSKKQNKYNRKDKSWKKDLDY